MTDFVKGCRDNDIGKLSPHTYVGSGYFGGFKILNFNIFWGFQKNEYFFFVGGGGGGHHNIGLYLGSISMHFRVFFNVQNGEYFLVAKI